MIGQPVALVKKINARPGNVLGSCGKKPGNSLLIRPPQVGMNDGSGALFFGLIYNLFL
jgi:hypothetical protein